MAVSDVEFGDDFIIDDSDGTVYICQNQLNILSVAHLKGGKTVTATVVVYSKTSLCMLVGPAAVRFDIGADSKWLYVSTTGGYTSSIAGAISFLSPSGF